MYIRGCEDLWDEYCRLCREVKELVREKKLTIRNEAVEKINVDFHGVGRAFVGSRKKGKKKNITSLKSDTGLLEVQGVSWRYYKGTTSIWGRLA